MEIKKFSSLTTRSWQGGSTTELLIFPPNSSYEMRNFSVRVSTAQIEQESSVFTHLPEIERYIMPIDQKIQIRHQGLYEKTLQALECDHFFGDYHTTAKGKCRDFNLMLSSPFEGMLRVVRPLETIHVHKNEIACLFALSDLFLLTETNEYFLETFDSAQFVYESQKITIKSNKEMKSAILAKAWS